IDTPTIAEALIQAGYTSASIGKWHLGGKGYGPEQRGVALNIGGDYNGVPLSYFYPFSNQREVMLGLEAGHAGEYLTDRLTDEGGLYVKAGPNTPATNNAPLRNGKGYLYEAGIRVPLIVYWPGVVRPGSISRAPVSGVDIFPTVSAIADLKDAAPADGLSLIS